MGDGERELNLFLQRDRTVFQNSDGDFTYEILEDSDISIASMDLKSNRLDYTKAPEYSLRLSASVSFNKLAFHETDLQCGFIIYINYRWFNTGIFVLIHV